MLRLINFKSNGAGFTLLEVIIAVFLITAGVVGVFSLIIFIRGDLINIQSRIEAVNLAQEGIELVRNIRDTNWKKNLDFKTNIDSGDWEVDYLSTSLSDDYDGDLLKRDANGFYNYTGGSPTIFQRKISISKIIDSDPEPDTSYLKVISRVEWQIKNKNYNIELESRLYDWK